MASADLLILISILSSMSLMKIANRKRPRTDSCRYYLITALHLNNERFVMFSMVRFYEQFGIHPLAVSQRTFFYLAFEKVKTLLKSRYVGLSAASYHQARLFRKEK